MDIPYLARRTIVHVRQAKESHHLTILMDHTLAVCVAHQDRTSQLVGSDQPQWAKTFTAGLYNWPLKNRP
jgi:hypothetical protein